ncbi:MAG TPA: hypothetical protein VFQ61_01225 [Polyangiaceae bacterium]|nr:hypothetical protein [Polyangiaceae bacterium]
MTDPKRLPDTDLDEFDRVLLNSAKGDVGSERALVRSLAAFSAASLMTPSATAALSKAAWFSALKFLGAGVLVGGLVVGAARPEWRTALGWGHGLDRAASGVRPSRAAGASPLASSTRATPRVAVVEGQLFTERTGGESTPIGIGEPPKPVEARAAASRTVAPQSDQVSPQRTITDRSEPAEKVPSLLDRTLLLDRTSRGEPHSVSDRTTATPDGAPLQGSAAFPEPPGDASAGELRTRRAADSTSDELIREVAVLDRARAALAQQRGARALHILDLYDREFPRGTLGPESIVIRVEALESVGAKEQARHLAEKGLRELPEGAHSARLRAWLRRSNP